MADNELTQYIRTFFDNNADTAMTSGAPEENDGTVSSGLSYDDIQSIPTASFKDRAGFAAMKQAYMSNYGDQEGIDMLSREMESRGYALTESKRFPGSFYRTNISTGQPEFLGSVERNANPEYDEETQKLLDEAQNPMNGIPGLGVMKQGADALWNMIKTPEGAAQGAEMGLNFALDPTSKLRKAPILSKAVNSASKFVNPAVSGLIGGVGNLTSGVAARPVLGGVGSLLMDGDISSAFDVAKDTTSLSGQGLNTLLGLVGGGIGGAVDAKNITKNNELKKFENLVQTIEGLPRRDIKPNTDALVSIFASNGGSQNVGHHEAVKLFNSLMNKQKMGTDLSLGGIIPNEVNADDVYEKGRIWANNFLSKKDPNWDKKAGSNFASMVREYLPFKVLDDNGKLVRKDGKIIDSINLILNKAASEAENVPNLRASLSGVVDGIAKAGVTENEVIEYIAKKGGDITNQYSLLKGSEDFAKAAEELRQDLGVNLIRYKTKHKLFSEGEEALFKDVQQTLDGLYNRLDEIDIVKAKAAKRYHDEVKAAGQRIGELSPSLDEQYNNAVRTLNKLERETRKEIFGLAGGTISKITNDLDARDYILMAGPVMTMVSEGRSNTLSGAASAVYDTAYDLVLKKMKGGLTKKGLELLSRHDDGVEAARKVDALLTTYGSLDSIADDIVRVFSPAHEVLGSRRPSSFAYYGASAGGGSPLALRSRVQLGTEDDGRLSDAFKLLLGKGDRESLMKFGGNSLLALAGGIKYSGKLLPATTDGEFTGQYETPRKITFAPGISSDVTGKINPRDIQSVVSIMRKNFSTLPKNEVDENKQVKCISLANQGEICNEYVDFNIKYNWGER